MHRKHWIALASSLALTGASLNVVAAPPPQVAQEKAQTFAQANGTQPGTVDNLSGGTLNIAPYNAGSDVKAFDVPSNAPIFRGNGKITSRGLTKGVPVRVHYKNATAEGQKPQAVAVEVLGNEEANAARQQAETAPPLMMAQVGAAPKAGTTAPAPPAPAGQLSMKDQIEKRQLFSSATGSQPGKIIKTENDKLFLDPYQQAAGDSELRFDPNAPVYQGNGRVSSASLASGTDVRVYYKTESNQKRPKVVAIEILNPDKAKQLEAAERDVPKHE